MYHTAWYCTCMLICIIGEWHLIIHYFISCFILGRYDLFHSLYYCNNCDEQFSLTSLETIISEGYWPGNPKQLNHVFSQDVFRLWDYVRKHMPGTSETAFLRSLGNISSEKGRVCNIWDVLNFYFIYSRLESCLV